MPLRAILADGREVRLHPRYGNTPDDLVAALTADSLTGSAVPLVDAQVILHESEYANGVAAVAYGEINVLMVETFESDGGTLGWVERA